MLSCHRRPEKDLDPACPGLRGHGANSLLHACMSCSSCGMMDPLPPPGPALTSTVVVAERATARDWLNVVQGCCGRESVL